MSRLDTVVFIPRRRIADARGWFLKAIDGKEAHLPPRTGEIYVVYAEPGKERGNHYHPETAEWFTLLKGAAELIVQDLETGERRSWILSEETPQTVYVPAGIGHVFVNTSKTGEPFILLAYAENLYEPSDTIPLQIVDKG